MFPAPGFHVAAGIVTHSSIQISGMLPGNSEFQLPPKIFCWVQVWRLVLLDQCF